ncbi:MAG: uroporphyrinogen decarboxylase family protein [Candidatus Omnitrophota bacterium]
MNNRERFMKTMHYEKVDHPPFYPDSPWEETKERWYREGYPQNVSLDDFLETERLNPKLLPIDTWLIPSFKTKVVSEDEKEVIRINQYGATIKTFKNSPHQSQWLDYVVKTESDLLGLVDRLKPDMEKRIPKNWEKTKKTWAEDPNSVTMAWGGSYFDSLRNLMGLERLCLMFYDSPGAIKKFLDAYHNIVMAVLETTLGEVRIDCIQFAEDFAYKTSLLLSPDMYQEFILPKHKTLTDFARKRGVDIFYFDSDGNLDRILPYLLKGGINLIFPVECAAGMDPLVLRKKYGRTLRMIGGIDKMKIAKGKESIEQELNKKIPPLIREGGYIPCIDHSVSSDISLENFVYYVDLLKKIYGVHK